MRLVIENCKLDRIILAGKAEEILRGKQSLRLSLFSNILALALPQISFGAVLFPVMLSRNWLVLTDIMYVPLAGTVEQLTINAMPKVMDTVRG